jgi:hypothetical protein
MGRRQRATMVDFHLWGRGTGLVTGLEATTITNRERRARK